MTSKKKLFIIYFLSVFFIFLILMSEYTQRFPNKDHRNKHVDTQVTTNKYNKTKFLENLNIGEHASVPIVGQRKCTDVVCSEFLTDADLACARKINAADKVSPSCHFQNGTIKPLLRSFPGSGNTWVRQLLEKSTGICTGSVYCDYSIWKSGMIGEGIQSTSVLVVKSHRLKTDGDATILIVRNPIDAILSYWKWNLLYLKMYEGEGKHVSNPPITFFQNCTEWDEFLKKKARLWGDKIRGEFLTSRQNKHPLLIVHYEDLKKNVSREVFRMLDFLNVDYSSGEVLGRLKDDATTFKRPKPTQDFDPYTPQQRQKVYSVLKGLVKWLKANGEEENQRFEQYLLQQ